MSKNIYIKETKRKGKGLFASRDFKKGELICRNRRGKTIKDKDIHKLSKEEQNHLNELDKDTCEIMKPPGKYVNHSCNPNAVAKGRQYFTLRRIKKGEEITIDYRVNGKFNNMWKCHCGSKNCTGWVTANFFTLSKKLQKKYLPYAPAFIKAEYKKRYKNL